MRYVKGEVRMSDYRLRPYQQTAYEELRKLLKTGGYAQLWADPGLGKTAIAAHAMLSCLERNERLLVLAPKRVCTDVWEDEFRLWPELKWHTIQNVAGKAAGVRRRILNDPAFRVVVANYEIVPWLFDIFRPGEIPFSGLLLDEVDKCKSVGTQRFKTLRRRVFEFKKRLTMTGTPGSEGLMDLWAQVYLCRPGALGTSFTRWVVENFRNVDWNGYKKEPLPGAAERTLRLIEPFTVRIDADDHLDVPEGIIKVYKTPMSRAHKKVYDDIETNFLARLDGGEELSVTESGAVHQTLRQLASGFFYQDDKTPRWFSTQKFEVLDGILSEIQSHQVLIVYHYRAQIDELRQRYPGLPFLGGGVSDAAAREAIVGWNAGRHRLMAIHPASASHGLNLQLSGAHHLVFLTLPYSSREHSQTVARLRRIGQSNVVVEHRILSPDSVDMDTVVALRTKNAGEKEILAAMRARRGIR